MMNYSVRPTVAVTLLLAIAGLAVNGCHHDVWEEQSNDIISQYRVPDSAKRVGEGTDTLEFRAPQNGIIYIVDNDQPREVSSKDGQTKKTVHRIVLQALLLGGNDYYFDPRAGLAGVRNSDREPSRVTTVPGHHYALMWDTKEIGDRNP